MNPSSTASSALASTSYECKPLPAHQPLTIPLLTPRRPYAIEMIDAIYASNQTETPILTALSQTLGADNGTAITTAILAHNPIWTARTTRLKILTDITRIAAAKRLLVHPDAHVSRAGPCCSHTDGNAWFGDTHFAVANWTRGLAYMARWAGNHSNVVSMGLRNELRESWAPGGRALEYNWVNYVGNMTEAADAVHAANPDILMMWGGMQFGQDLSALTTEGKNLWTADCYRCSRVRDGYRREPMEFDLDDHPWGDKVVWELHLDENSEDLDTGSCRVIEADLYRNGFNALGIPSPAACNITGGGCEPAKRLTPVILSEVGRAQNEGLLNSTLLACQRVYTTGNKVSWMMWSLAGSYRIRDGVLGVNDTWGLLNATWDGWQYPEGVDAFWGPWVREMGLNGTAGNGARAT